MQQTSTTIPGYMVNEYLLILSPTSELYQRILFIKYDFAERYKAPLAAYTKPHITLINFLAYQRTEEKILNRFRLIGTGIAPFTIQLENFGSFDASRTIYVNVFNKTSVRYLVQELKPTKYLLALNRGYRPRFIYEPHLSVCRGLNSRQYEMGWMEYSSRYFSGSFVADRMTLLKRAYGENRCQTVGQFLFQSTPSLPIQGRLLFE